MNSNSNLCYSILSRVTWTAFLRFTESTSHIHPTWQMIPGSWDFRPKRGFNARQPVTYYIRYTVLESNVSLKCFPATSSPFSFHIFYRILQRKINLFVWIPERSLPAKGLRGAHGMSWRGRTYPVKRHYSCTVCTNILWAFRWKKKRPDLERRQAVGAFAQLTP
jgi:hypothetical protein